jgi:hypothetical protein
VLAVEVVPNIVPPPKPPKLVPAVAVGTVLNKPPPEVWVVFPNKEVPVEEVGAPNVDAKPPKPAEEAGTPKAELVGAPKEPVPPNAVPALGAPNALGAAVPNAEVVEVIAPKGVVFAVDVPKAGAATAPKAGAACPNAGCAEPKRPVPVLVPKALVPTLVPKVEPVGAPKAGAAVAGAPNPLKPVDFKIKLLKICSIKY